MEPTEQFKQATKIVFEELMANGNNFMEGAILADGRLFKIRIEIREVIE